MFSKAFLIDAGERVVSSFLEAVIAVVVAGGVTTLNASTAHVLILAGLTAAVATVKTILAGIKTDTVSPASLAGPAKKNDGGYGLVELVVALFLIVVFIVVLFEVLPVHHR